MPITPKFIISQDESFVYVQIKVPHIRVSSAELVVEGPDFTFYCKPYLLKLSFPYEVLEDDRCKGIYDAENDDGTITAHLPKKIIGQHFPDLDLTTLLLQNRISKDRIHFPSIDIIDSTENKENDEQEVTEIFPRIIKKPTYGFNQKYSDILTNLREDTIEVIELLDPDSTPESSRRTLREKDEEIHFDSERYLGDFYEGENDPIYIEAITFEPYWEQQWKQWKDGRTAIHAFDQIGGFTEDDKLLMTQLPKREYLIPKDSIEEKNLLLNLLDILFAYCYDVRITAGEPTVESNISIVIQIQTST
eukprot:gene917-1780_t